jgi:hypothetical protein
MKLDLTFNNKLKRRLSTLRDNMYPLVKHQLLYNTWNFPHLQLAQMAAAFDRVTWVKLKSQSK